MRASMVILQGVYTGGDRADAAEIWAGLGLAWLNAQHEIAADPADPQQATLTGHLRIVVSWVRNPIASAQVDKLKLVRVPGKNDHWQIPETKWTKPPRQPVCSFVRRYVYTGP